MDRPIFRSASRHSRQSLYCSVARRTMPRSSPSVSTPSSSSSARRMISAATYGADAASTPNDSARPAASSSRLRNASPLSSRVLNQTTSWLRT